MWEYIQKTDGVSLCLSLWSYQRADGSRGPRGGAERQGVGGVLGQEVVSRGECHVIDMLKAGRGGDEAQMRRGERRTGLQKEPKRGRYRGVKWRKKRKEKYRCMQQFTAQ